MKLFEKRKRWLSLLLLLLLLGGSYSVYSYVRARSNLNKVRTLQQEMASQGSTWTPEQRREKGEQLRAAMAKLNSSQRSGLAEEGRQRFEQDLRSYHAMTPQAKVQYLDQQIRRSEERRRQMGGNPAGNQQGRPTMPINAGGGPPGGNPAGKAGGSGGRSSSPEEREKRRKERLNRSTPEFRSLMDEFRRDMETRRKQLGLPPRTR
jgi:cell division protein FtsB